MLQACLNGARQVDAHPAMPSQPHELASDARMAVELGVESIHVHPRTADGLETLDTAPVAATVAAIRAVVPGIEIGVTTARWVAPNPQRRIEAVTVWGRLGAGRPDVASVNVHERGWQEVCAALHAVGIGVELGVWTSGDAVRLRTAGVPPGTVRVQAEVTVTDPVTAVAEAARILRALGPLSVPVLLHGEEAAAWPVLEHAQRLGLDTRIGFEDTLTGPDRDWLATGNAELVRIAVGQQLPARFVKGRPRFGAERRR